MYPKKRGMRSRVYPVLFRPAFYSPDIFDFVCLFQCSESEVILHCHLGIHQQARIWSPVCHSWPGEHAELHSPHALTFSHL